MYRSQLTGEGMEHIIVTDGSLRSASPVVENAYVTVAQCAERDPRYAGQIALNLAQMLLDLQSCQGKVEEKLRGVVDMMRMTSTLVRSHRAGCHRGAVHPNRVEDLGDRVERGGRADHWALYRRIVIIGGILHRSAHGREELERGRLLLHGQDSYRLPSVRLGVAHLPNGAERPDVISKRSPSDNEKRCMAISSSL